MSTPPGPKTPGASPSDAASRPSLEQTFLGVAPPARVPVNVAEPPSVPPATPRAVSAPPPTPSRDAIVAAPVIPVSSKVAAAPLTPRVVATPAADERAAPAPSGSPPAAPASEQTLMHPTPRAVGSPASPLPMRNPFPKPEPYAIPPRAGDGARHPGGADRTALSADYLRAAREAALGRGGSGQEPLAGAGVPTQRVLGNRAAFSTTPANRVAYDQLRDEPPPSFSTQQSLGSEPPPRAPNDAANSAPRRSPDPGTVLEAPRGLPPPPSLPALPAIPPSERGPASSATRFEPVPAARTHLSDRGGAIAGQSLGHISVDWSPERAERVRSASPAPKSRVARFALLGLGALVLIVLGFVTLGGPLRRLAARVAGRAPATEVERTAAPVAPSVTTLSNRPAQEPAPADRDAPAEPEVRPAP